MKTSKYQNFDILFLNSREQSLNFSSQGNPFLPGINPGIFSALQSGFLILCREENMPLLSGLLFMQLTLNCPLKLLGQLFYSREKVVQHPETFHNLSRHNGLFPLQVSPRCSDANLQETVQPTLPPFQKQPQSWSVFLYLLQSQAQSNSLRHVRIWAYINIDKIVLCQTVSTA